MFVFEYLTTVLRFTRVQRTQAHSRSRSSATRFNIINLMKMYKVHENILSHIHTPLKNINLLIVNWLKRITSFERNAHTGSLFNVQCVDSPLRNDTWWKLWLCFYCFIAVRGDQQFLFSIFIRPRHIYPIKSPHNIADRMSTTTLSDDGVDREYARLSLFADIVRVIYSGRDDITNCYYFQNNNIVEVIRILIASDKSWATSVDYGTCGAISALEQPSERAKWARRKTRWSLAHRVGFSSTYAREQHHRTVLAYSARDSRFPYANQSSPVTRTFLVHTAIVRQSSIVVSNPVYEPIWLRRIDSNEFYCRPVNSSSRIQMHCPIINGATLLKIWGKSIKLKCEWLPLPDIFCLLFNEFTLFCFSVRCLNGQRVICVTVRYVTTSINYAQWNMLLRDNDWSEASSDKNGFEHKMCALQIGIVNIGCNVIESITRSSKINK